jgi:excisionase family DNA binding protein
VTEDRVLTLTAVATRWGWSRSKLYRAAVERNEIPYLRIGGNVHFRERDLDAWLAAQIVPVKASAATRTVAVDRNSECRALGIEPEHRFT